MRDVTPMSVFINHPFYVGYPSSQYGTKVLQSPSFKHPVFLLGPCHAVIQYHMTLLGRSETIYNDLGKMIATCVLSAQND